VDVAAFGKRKRMKVLIHDKSRHLYLAERGRWATEVAQGRDFVTTPAAISHLVARGLTGVELYYAFPNPKYDFGFRLLAFLPPVAPTNASARKMASLQF